jgi:hypothetical protein
MLEDIFEVSTILQVERERERERERAFLFSIGSFEISS